MATKQELIVRLQHLLMTARDDLTPEAEGRQTWNKIYDLLVKFDLTITAVSIMQIPRTAEQAVMPSDTSPCIPFGKYQGRTINEIAASDKKYLIWLLGNVEFRSDKLKQAIEEAVK